jgi:hypothetical protein
MARSSALSLQAGNGINEGQRLAAATGSMPMGGGTGVRLTESVPAAARSLREAGGHSRGILVPRVCSDLLALSASRLGGG